MEESNNNNQKKAQNNINDSTIPNTSSFNRYNPYTNPYPSYNDIEKNFEQEGSQYS